MEEEEEEEEDEERKDGWREDWRGGSEKEKRVGQVEDGRKEVFVE